MTTLYYRPRTSGRPMRVAWLLEELGVDYEAVPVDTDSAEHHERSPLGRVPVLDFDDGETLFDTTAILLAIADRHPDSGVIGPLGSLERDLAYQWCLTAQTELEKAAIGVIMGGGDDDDSRALYRSVCGAIDGALADHPHLAGDTFGVADITTVGVMFISQREELVVKEAPERVREYFARVGARPALARAAERTESLLQPAELLPS